MVTINIDPVIFNIGHFAIRWYSLILLVAISIGLWLAGNEAENKGFNKEEVYDSFIWIVIGGLIGARLFHVIDHWANHYSLNPVTALYIWEGGLAIWGAIVGGGITASIIARQRGWNLRKFADSAAPGLVLAQGIGRFACIITGDSVGKPTNGPFGLAYTHPNAMVTELGVYYTPMPVYEIIGNLVIFTILWQLRKRRMPDGMLFLIYLALYSVERFFLSFTSAYRVIALGMTQSQIVSLLGLSIAIPLIIWLKKKSPIKARYRV